jgi:polyhydroxyalkanoate synthase
VAKKTQTPKAQPEKPAAQRADSTPSPNEFDLSKLNPIDPEDLERLEETSRTVMQTALKSQKLMSDVMRRSLEGDTSLMPQADPLHAAPELLQAWEHILSDPELLLQAQADLYRGYLDLWSGATKKLVSGEESEPAIAPEKGDKRWRSKAWSENPLFDAMKQSYLLNQRFMMGLISGAKGH